MNYIQLIFLSIFEGIVEYLPISSTGHMILLSNVIGISQNKMTDLIISSIQFGSVLSILFLYRKKIFYRKIHFYLHIITSICPIFILGLILKRIINESLIINNYLIFAISLIIGGIIILISENIYEKKMYYKKINFRISLIIGIFQCLSIIPGVSRSAVTIISGMLQNVNRKDSVEFSFFLSIPVFGLIVCKKIFDYFYFGLNNSISYDLIHCYKLLILGNIISFCTSIIIVKYLIEYLKCNSFKIFGYYRIILGILLLFFKYKNYIQLIVNK